MSTYTADDFKNARFAVHESGRAHAMRLAEHENDQQPWTYQRPTNPRFFKDASDVGMASMDGWVPVQEENQAKVLKLHQEIARLATENERLEELLEDEAVERAARAIAERAIGSQSGWRMYEDQALAALTAAIEGDET